MNKKAITLLEILIAILILAITMVNLVNLFVSGKRYVLHARSRMSAAELSRSFFDSLQMDVRQDLWGTNCLGTNGVSGCSGSSWTIDNVPYSPSWSITDLIPGKLKKAIVTVSWTENLP